MKHDERDIDWQEAHGRLAVEMNRVIRERDEARAEVERLRGVLGKARVVIRAAINSCMTGTTAEAVLDEIHAAMGGE